MLERLGPVVGGALVAALLAVLLGGGDEPPPAGQIPVEGQPAVDGFLAAYERSLLVEAVVVSETRRTMADGRELAYEQRLVQRPPDDRLVVGVGSASGRIDGRTVRCTSVAGSSVPRCVTGDAAAPYDEYVQDQLDAFARLLEPEVGAYEVATLGDGCFHLRLRLRVFTPPYGIESRFCFDEAVGVLRDVEVVRPEATDRTTALEVRTTVTAADLRVADIGDPLATG